MTQAAARLETATGRAVPLKGTRVEALAEDLLFEVRIVQTYRNDEDANIEAVYTFPLPAEATLLDFEARIGDRTLRSEVAEKKEARERYEDAVVEGHGAVLLEEVEPNLHNVSVGNLLPGEEAVLSFRYGLPARWQGDSVRFLLPTAAAPRYGSPEKAGLEPHQIPEADLRAENFFSLKMVVSGALKDASIQSPSHRIEVERGEEATTISLGRAFMDRDFVLNMTAPSLDERSGALCARDRDGYVVMASFCPALPRGPRQPRSVKIVVDCSGSMAGDSIAQARKALHLILESLSPDDWFNVVRFGTRCEKLFRKQVRAEGKRLAEARRFVFGMDADMGGTELRGALRETYAVKGPGGVRQDVLLVTDGEVWEMKETVEDAVRSGHRLFTVGVGSAVSERLVRDLAERTGGAAELASPNEAMAERVHRHFRRIYASPMKKVEVEWPEAPERVFPEEIGSVFDGDTVYAFGWFRERPRGKAILRGTLENGASFARETPLRFAGESPERGSPGTLARMAAAARMKGLEDRAEILELALLYRLASPCTSLFALTVRSEEERARDLPELRRTPHMLAAGWGGSGRVAADLDDEDILRELSSPPASIFDEDLSAMGEFCLDLSATDELRLELDEELSVILASIDKPPAEEGCEGLWDDLDERFRLDQYWRPTLDELLRRGLPSDLAAELKRLVEGGEKEEAVVAALLGHLVRKDETGWLSRQARRVVAKILKESSCSRELLDTVGELVDASF